jgi:predicted transcriptional regulator
MPKPSTTSLKLDIEVKKRVQRLASVRRRSPHWLMREAIEDHYQTTGLYVTAEDADAWLAKLEAGKGAAPPKCRV